ncbi:F-box protein At3g47030-like [Capsella rubella]|uniref:F-box protein At3g47030-like n=1 Tax=Capsella rubella TaxID=81985 RepID=UPI000CD5946E|nr:F-box protein At3g47030-like [Capsella rubella]
MFGILGFNASMGKRQKQVMVSSPSKSSTETSKEITDDVLIDIFSRLPPKAVARCRCLSKRWSSMMCHQHFTQLYLKKSSVRPRMIFTLLCNGKRIFYSIPQDLDPDRDYFNPITPNCRMHFPKGLDCNYEVCPSILGFICTESRKPMICNPSTREYISLPIATTKKHQTRTCFGYDPINKLFKILCVSDDYVCRVATLGTSVVTWRRVECSTPHQPLHTQICIDGVLYYIIKCMDVTPTRFMVVCFDVTRETFKFLGVDWLRTYSSALINYHGKLGILSLNYFGFDLRVLEDANEAEWSKTVYILPNQWKHLATAANLDLVGMTSEGEFVLSKIFLEEPFYVYYFNTVKNTVVQVQIDFGTLPKKAYYSPEILTLINHVENVELIN